MNGYNFTERVRKAIALGRDEAVRIGHEYIGTEHILLGLLKEGGGVASTVIRRLGHKPEDLEAAVHRSVKPGNPQARRVPAADLPWTSRGKKALDLATAAARELSHNYVGTEHVLLGLIDEENGIAANVLKSFNIGPHNTRAEVLSLVGSNEQGDLPPRQSLAGRIKRRVWRNSVGARAGFNFTSRLRQTLTEARTIAADMHHDAVEPEHILLGLIRESEVAANTQGTALRALARCGVDPSTLRAAVVSQLRPGDFAGREADLPFSKSGKAVLEYAFNEARTLGHSHMGTEHALLGLLREDDGIAAQVLKAQGLTMAGLRAAIEGIGGRATGEIETDGANLVVADPSSERDSYEEPTRFSLSAADPQALPMIVAALVVVLEREPETAKLFAEVGITAETLRELAKKLKS